MRGNWTVRNIYLYLVCLITLIILIFGTANLVRNLVELVYPEPARFAVPVPESEGAEAPRVDPAELAEQEAFQRQWTRRSAVLGLVSSGALVLISGPIYLYHWRKIERE